MRCIAILLAPSLALAQPVDGTAGPALPTPTDAAQAAKPSGPTTEQLADENEDRKQEIARIQRILEAHRDEINSMKWLRRYITAVIDLGAFAVGGDGSGVRADYAHLYYPRDVGRARGDWTIMGDPLSTMINALGEPADIGVSRSLRDDSVNAGGHAAVIVNSIGLALGKEVGHHLAVRSLIQFLPRPRENILDIELAEIDYRPWNEINFMVSAGKVDSVLGVEYRAQDALQRLTVTPSLICRYTCGRPVGVRARLDQKRFSVSGSITNGDNFIDRFEPHESLKPNRLPTAAGHVQWILPVGQGLELGVSGALGPQDAQSDTSTLQWHYGFDAKLRDLAGFDAVAEWVAGKQPGRMETVPCDRAKCLTYKGGYVLVDRRVNAYVTPYVRLDWRDAVHADGVSFLYESHTLRVTAGANFALTSRILGKIEYTFNRERDAIPEFPDDVLTSSIVVATD